MLTWLERLPHDPGLQAFVAAEIARAGIELDTMRWRQEQDRQRIAALTTQLQAAQTELRVLRRRVGRGPQLNEAVV